MRAAQAVIARWRAQPGAVQPIDRNMTEATFEVISATLLRHARFAPVAGHEPAPVARVTLIPGGGMPLQVRLRS